MSETDMLRRIIENAANRLEVEAFRMNGQFNAGYIVAKCLRNALDETRTVPHGRTEPDTVNENSTGSEQPGTDDKRNG